jgi:hypothetical protein
VKNFAQRRDFAAAHDRNRSPVALRPKLCENLQNTGHGPSECWILHNFRNSAVVVQAEQHSLSLAMTRALNPPFSATRSTRSLPESEVGPYLRRTDHPRSAHPRPAGICPAASRNRGIKFFRPGRSAFDYYPEVEQLIRETAGAEKAVAFEHDMRCASKVRSTGIIIGLASLSLEMMREMLTEIYDWFTEGFDTLALKEASSLLEELGANTGTSN